MATQIARTTDRQLDLKALLEQPAWRAKLAAVLPKHLTVERMVRLALLATNRTSALLECSPQSILVAMMDAGRFGVEPDGIDAALVPYRSKHGGGRSAQFQMMYRGLMRLAKRSGQVRSIRARVVHERDRFVYKDTLAGITLEHEPCLDGEDPGPWRLVYAIADLAEGEPQIEVMTRAQVYVIRARSQAYASGDGPWVTDEEEMARKTAVKRLCKYLPRVPELDEALAHEAAEERTFDAPTVAMMPAAPAIEAATARPANGRNDARVFARPEIPPSPPGEPGEPVQAVRGRDVAGSPGGPPAPIGEQLQGEMESYEDEPNRPAPPAAPAADEVFDRAAGLGRARKLLADETVLALERAAGPEEILPTDVRRSIDLALIRHFGLGPGSARAPIVEAWARAGVVVGAAGTIAQGPVTAGRAFRMLAALPEAPPKAPEPERAKRGRPRAAAPAGPAPASAPVPPASPAGEGDDRDEVEEAATGAGGIARWREPESER